MLVSPIYNLIMDFMHYIYRDGFFSITSITFTCFVLWMYYELSKDWYYDNLENGYVNKDYEESYRIKEPIKKKLELEEENNKQGQEKEELQLYKMFNHKK